MSEQLKFRISSALKSIIGRDLITDDFIAIFELVKNSFDAEAQNIVVDFKLGEKGGDKIFILDDGYGMNESDLREKWLFVAYSAKKEGEERHTAEKSFAGNKGVGRFSCDRLGGSLRIQSKTREEDVVHNLFINWGDFEQNSKLEFQEVDVSYEQRDAYELSEEYPPRESGVVLEITDLRDTDSWDRSKFIRLRRALAKLVPPFHTLEEQGKISLRCGRELPIDEENIENRSSNEDAVDIVNGPIVNNILEVLQDKTTTLNAIILENGSLEVELIDRGATIYKTREDSSTLFPELTQADFNCSISYLNKSARLTFARRMGIPSVQYGSIFLIRNGFLVYPVGEDGDDYWGLNRRKVQGHARFLGSRETMGFVSVSGPESAFKESSSRDKGLIHTKASAQLSHCVLHCIKKLEAYVVGVTWRDKLDKEYSTPERISLDENRKRIIELIETLSSSESIEVLDYNKDLIGILNDKVNDFGEVLLRLKTIAKNENDTSLQKDIRKAEREFKKAREAEARALKIAEEEARARREAEKKAREETARADQATEQAEVAQLAYEEEKKRSLFLLGGNTRDKDVLEGFLHQIVLYAADAKVSLSNALTASSSLSKNIPDEIRQLLTKLNELNEKIITSSRFAIHGNFRMDSSYITDDLPNFICLYLENISKAYISRPVISYSTDEKVFEKKFMPIELGIALENLINNAKKARASKIDFRISVRENVLHLEVKDNGLGLDKSISEKNRIFEKGFSRTRGSGLGLYICKQTFEKLGGDISIADEQSDRGMLFNIRVGK